MNGLATLAIICPYCGETMDILVDLSAGRQGYVEDCQICCRPIDLQISIDSEGEPTVTVSRDDD